MSKNFPPIPDIQNGEEGLVVREKLNAVIGQTNKQWDHSTKQNNPHNVKAPQVKLEPVLAPLSANEQNVQDALEFLLGRFSESGGDWYLTHIDGNHVYIEIKHGPDSEFPPTTADLQLAELKINHDEGQLWTRLADDTIVKIGDKDFITEAPLDGELYGRKDGDWHRVSLANVSDDMPDNPSEGDLWIDTKHTMELYAYIESSGWISMTGAGGGGGGTLPDNIVTDSIDGTIVNKLLGREVDDQGEGIWRPIYTDDIITRGAQPMFRSLDTGRFTKATDPSAIRDQQTANWFLYESMLEMGDVHVDIDPPDDPTDGDMWYDTVRLELFVYAEGAWLPCSPLGARVDAGEILQAEILSRVEAGETKQAQIAGSVDNKLGKDERNMVTEDFRILGDRKTFISTNGNELGLYNVRTPTGGPHATNKEYVDSEIDRKISAIELPESDVDKAYVDQQDDALDARITSGEQLQNDIFADVRQNKSDISSLNILSQQNYGNIDKKLDKAGGTMTGDIAMSGKKITGLADPTANAHAATKKYVDSKAGDIDGLQLDVGYRMHATWKYMGDSHEASNLADGEFTIRTEGGAKPIMKIYLAGQDAHGRRWYAWSDNKESYSHGLGAQYCSITDRDGEVRKAGKLVEGTFNNSGNQYVRLTCEYYKSNWAFTVGNYYTINAAGLLPHAHYIDHYEYNQSPRMVAQASNKEEELASVVIGLPMGEVPS